METFAPEFAHHWLVSQYGSASDVETASRDETSEERAALEQLAERVTAARLQFPGNLSGRG